MQSVAAKIEHIYFTYYHLLYWTFILGQQTTDAEDKMYITFAIF